MNLSVIRDLSDLGGLLAFGGCPGLRVRPDGGLELCDAALAETVRQLRGLSVRKMVGHVGDEDLPEIYYADIERAMTAAGIEVERHPIPDFSVPDAAQEVVLGPVLTNLADRIRRGEGVFLHCLAGDGRSAVMAGCVLVRLGMGGPDALRAVRAARPAAIETDRQLAYLLDQSAEASRSSR